MRAASSALSRLPSLASRSSILRQNISRSATNGGIPTAPSPAMCSWRTLPATRRVSTRLTCKRSLVWRKRTNIVVAR
jgi:hypothetical protein